MPALITDKLRKASNGAQPVVTTLASDKPNGTATASLAVATGWNTATAVDVIMYRITATGTIVAGSQTFWVALLSGTSLSSMVLRGGTEPASGYTADSYTVVECGPTAAWADDLITATLTSLDQDGTLKAGAVDNTAALADGIVTQAKFSTAAGELGGAWTTWTPTWTNLTVGTGTVTAKYQQTGKTVRGRVLFTLASGSTVGSGPTFSLPVTANGYNTSNWNVGGAYYIDTGVSTYYGFTALLSSNTVASAIVGGAAGTYTGPSILTSTVPHAWGSGDQMTFTFEYEAA